MAVSAVGAAGEQLKWATGRGDPAAAVGRGPSGPSEPPGRPGPTGGPPSARALLRLLQATAVSSSGRGWRDVLYTCFVGLLITGSAGMYVFGLFTFGFLMLQLGKTVVYIASHTAFFGLQFALMWLSLVICFVAGRRPYGELLLTIENLMERDPLHGSVYFAKKLRKRFNWLLCAVILLMGLTGAMSFGVQPWEQQCSTVTGCSASLVFGLLLWVFFFSAYLIPFKLVYAALQVSTGFSTINLQLHAVVDGERPPDRLELHRLRAMQDELSRAFTRLTGSMSPELITLMLSGTLQMIAILMQLIGSFEAGDQYSSGPLIATYLSGAAVVVALPCEMTQRMLDAVSETRDLLLRSEWQRPELFQELSLFRDTVGRDLATLGDLGLFRLQRPTLLAVSATVLTYIIILVQFYVTELAN